MAFASEALGTDDLFLYQCQAWAKFTGDADYDQPFHCDFVNHTLTGPSDEDALNSVTSILLFSDVTEAHGPTHYVTRPDSLKVAGPEATMSRRSGAAGRAASPTSARRPARPARCSSTASTSGTAAPTWSRPAATAT